MRRIFQNTTAIATCLSLLASQMAAAQTADGTVLLPPPGETLPQADAATTEADATEATDAEADTEAEAEAEAEVEADAEANAAEPEAELEADADAEAEAEVHADEMVDAATEAGADADATADTGVTGEATTTTETEAAAALETAVPESDATATTDTDTAAPTGAAEVDATADTSVETTAETSGETTEAAGDTATTTTTTGGVAALDGSATGEVAEEEITEENRRSSTEDFATPLDAGASAEASQTTATGGDSDSNSDLARALLLGLGGVAVGAMLSNNRQVALSTPDRIVVARPDGTQQLLRDDVVLLRQPGSTVTTETFDDGSTRTVVTRADGSQVVTIRDADLRVLRRTLVSADGTQTVLLDDMATAAASVDLASLPQPTQTANPSLSELDEAQLREALMREAGIDQRFSLTQIRDVEQLRLLAPAIDVETITFETGSAAIPADQAESLTTLGNVMREAIESNPTEMFLVEGHTDTVGDPAINLALSDRRAESVALALVERFQVPPENMVVQGYGEQFLKVQQEGDVRENRRAAVRRITDLLASSSQ